MLRQISFLFFSFTVATAYVVGSGVQANPGSNCNVCGNNPVMGNWGEWGPWSSCSAASGTPSQTRQRVCSAAQCPGGSATESRGCVLYDPAPQWGEWNSFGTCSASCGGGICTRTRVCNNGCSSCQCVGSSVEQKACNTQPCCDWTQWSAWSACSVTCGGGGYRTRTRQCSCLTGCIGNSSEQQECNAQIPCPAPCNTCQPVYEPPPCTTCGNPAPCTTCNQPPVISCPTCGEQPYYNPYGRKKRLAAAANTTVV